MGPPAPRSATATRRPRTRRLIWGATALVALFLVTLPFVMARLAFPVQLQISRVFWLVDALATVYLLSLLVDRRAGQGRGALLLVPGARSSRGAYIMLVERPERALFAVHLVESPWHDAMRWLSRQPVNAHVLADPGTHGSTARACGCRPAATCSSRT